MEIDITREAMRVYYQVLRSKDAELACTLTLEEWISIIEQFNGLCAYCENRPFETMDHLIPHSVGGGTTKENCVPACRVCNSRKHAFVLRELEHASSLQERVKLVRDGMNILRAIPYTTIRLEQADREAIARIRELYGCPSDSAAIKLAVRMVARGPGAQAPNKERALYPHDFSQGREDAVW